MTDWNVRVELEYIAGTTEAFRQGLISNCIQSRFCPHPPKSARNIFSMLFPPCRALSPEKRNCFFEGEVELDLFPVYHEANCVLECAWAHAEVACGCVPWFLAPSFPSSRTCEVYGNRCFSSAVGRRYDSPPPCARVCLPDCDKVHYEVARDKVADAQQHDVM